MTRLTSVLATGLLTSALLLLSDGSANATPAGEIEDNTAHGLWVWKSPSVLAVRRGAETLRDFCTAEGINEVYVGFPASGDGSVESQMAHLIDLLHRSNIRAEALLSSEDADEPGRHREALLGRVREVIDFNRRHSADRFDGIHLDIEPQQRPENKGSGNLRFLPGLVDTYRAVRTEAEGARLTVNADIQIKLLKGNRAERKMLLESLPRLTLMLYELNSPADGSSIEEQTHKLLAASRNLMDMAYAGLAGPDLASLTVALRTPDYGPMIPQMLKALDEAHRGNLRYRGWARHSYNDTLTPPR